MPIYEYVCFKCDCTFSMLEKMSTDDELTPETRCPSCGTQAWRKISLSSFHLKGDGWYKTPPRREEKRDESENR